MLKCPKTSAGTVVQFLTNRYCSITTIGLVRYLHMQMPLTLTMFNRFAHGHLYDPGIFSHSSPTPLHEKLPVRHSFISKSTVYS